MIGKAILVLFGIFAIFSLVFSIERDVCLDREVTGWYQQAMASADAKQLYKFTQKTMEGLRKNDLTTGYHALLYKTPDNDMAVEYEIIQGCAARALEIQKYPIGSMDYAKSLDDVRQQLRAVGISPTYGYMVKYHRLFIIYWGLFGWLPTLLVGITLWETPHIGEKLDRENHTHKKCLRWWW